MSTPPPTQSALLGATQQKLDELDALIQRMLAVPVVETEHDPLEAVGFMDASPALVGIEDESPIQSAVAPLLIERNQEPMQAEPSLAAGTRPTLEVSEAVDSQLHLPSVREQVNRNDSSRSVSPWHWPLVAANCAFDLATWPLGPAGAWLRGESGRMFLGFAGLALLTAAAVLGLLDWILANC